VDVCYFHHAHCFVLANTKLLVIYSLSKIHLNFNLFANLILT
jgi:hypothetical protein